MGGGKGREAGKSPVDLNLTPEEKPLQLTSEERNDSVPVSTSWVQKSKKSKDIINTQEVTTLKTKNEVKKFKIGKNKGQIMDKTTKIKTNHISKFRADGPSYTFGAGTVEIGGRVDTCSKSWETLESQRNQGIGPKERGLESRATSGATSGGTCQQSAD